MAEVVVATTLASQRAALDRKERDVDAKLDRLARAARELNKQRNTFAVRQAQLETAYIEFQKRESGLREAEEELRRQRRVLKHHRDNDVRVRAVTERRVQHNPRAQLQPTRCDTANFELRDEEDAHDARGANRITEAAEHVYRAAEEFIDAQRLELRRDTAERNAELQWREQRVQAREEAAARLQSQAESAAAHLRLIVSKADAAGLPIASEIAVLLRRVESSLVSDTTFTVKGPLAAQQQPVSATLYEDSDGETYDDL
jgi:hypothetical protein